MKSYYKFKTSDKNGVVKVEVEVIDSKTAYGRKMCQITPVRGEGKVWVNQDKVIIEKR